ncbi:MAG: hypothetical protein U9R28_10090 [Pseudomonadota bacterium]|nr:hypothetical protein [Pseudomonadota bacterium]
MKAEKAKFTWHYYGMAFGALMAMLAGTVGSIGGIVSGIAFAILCHPVIKFQGVGRFVFLVLFAILYVFAFPEPDVVREMMAGTE